MLNFLTWEELGHRVCFLRVVLIHTAFFTKVCVIDPRGDWRPRCYGVLDGSWSRHVILLSMRVGAGEDVFGLLFSLNVEVVKA
mgnify:CR=1 FL=1